MVVSVRVVLSYRSLLRDNSSSAETDHLITHLPGLLFEAVDQTFLVLTFIRLLPLIYVRHPVLEHAVYQHRQLVRRRRDRLRWAVPAPHSTIKGTQGRPTFVQTLGRQP